MIWGLVIFAVFYALVVGYKLSKKGGNKYVSDSHINKCYDRIGSNAIRIKKNEQQIKHDLESITGISQ